MAIFGGTSLTLYSLFIAHANDYLSPSQMVSTSSSLVTVTGIGAPLVAAAMDIFGDRAYASLIGFIHLGLAIFVGYRMTVRPAIPAEAQGHLVLYQTHQLQPAVSLNPETEWIDNSPDALAEADPLEDYPYFP